MPSKKIVLVIPPQVEMTKDYLPSIGVAYLAAMLEKNGYEVKIIDSFVEKFGNNQTVESILKEHPFLLGISANTHNRFNAIEIFEQIKKKSNGEIFTVAGGPHFTPTAQDALINIPSLDFVVRNEGEKTIIQLVDQLTKDSGINPENLKGINGLTFRVAGEIISTPDRDFVKNLDELPSPAWHLFNLNKYDARLEGLGKYRTIGIMSSRGCPHNCIFCVNSVFWKRILRRRSPKKFVDEIEFLITKYDFRAFDFWDDTMTIVHSHIEEICHEILNRNLSIKWYARARVDTVDFNLLSLMKKAGCRAISFGVESGSEKILKIIDKKITLDQARNVAKFCKELGLITKFFFIHSLPQENEDDLNITLDFMNELESYDSKFHCYAGIARIYPGTQLEFLAKKEGRLPNDFNWYKPVWFGLNKEIGADPIIPLYENENLPLRRITEIIKMGKKKKINKLSTFDLIKKGIKLILRAKNIKGIKSMVKKFIDLKFKKQC